MTLEVLLTELNVTKAAERLNLSQPSVSVQLGKVRNIYNDPLLLPGPRGMLPTSRAIELLQPLRSALTCLLTAATLGTSSWLDLLDWDFHPTRDIQLSWRSSPMSIARVELWFRLNCEVGSDLLLR